MLKIFFLAGLVFSVSLVYASPFAENDTSKADAVLTHATVYFGYGSEITHESKVKINSGTRFIVINQLSTSVDVGSLQISCPENVTLLSHRFLVFTPPAPDVLTGKEVEKLQDSLEIVRKEINRIDNLVNIEQETLLKTGALIQATVDAGGTKTSAEVLKLVDYYNARIAKTKMNIYNYQQDQDILKKRLTGLQIRIDILKSDDSRKIKSYGQLILQVLCNKAEEIPVSLSYYSYNAGWRPVYDIRVNSKTNKVKLIYKASLTQTTGIDWKKAKLTLSTGTPNLGVAAPVLSAWYLQLYVPQLYKQLEGRIAGLQINTVQSFKSIPPSSFLRDAQGAISETMQSDSVIVPSTLEDFTTLNEGQLNTSFDIDLPYEIASDGEMHSVTIKDEEINCTLKNYSVPKLDKETYLLAEVSDWENLDLLPGDANIIMDDTYVGKSMIDPNTTADTLNLSLGRDKRLVVKKTLVRELSSLKTSGKDSRQTFTYELSLKNNKLTDVNLLLKDQYPLSTIKEVEVKLDDNGEAMVNEETGVLTWKVQLKPGESKKIRFTYTVKYPKEQRIVNLK